MELSSLIVPNNKKHFVVVFIGLVLIFKIALITAANEKSQVRYKWSNFDIIFLRSCEKFCNFNFLMMLYLDLHGAFG